MSDQRLSVEHPRQIVAEMRQLVAERAPAESAIPTQWREEERAAQAKLAQTRQAVTGRYEQVRASARAEHASNRRRIVGQYAPALSRLQADYQRLRDEAIADCDQGEADARRRLQEARWEATSVFEAAKDGPALRLRQIQEQVAARRGELGQVQASAERLLRQRRQWRAYAEPGPQAPPADDQVQRRFAELLAEVNERLRMLQEQRLPTVFEGAQPVGVVLGVCLVVFLTSALILGWQGWLWLVVGAVVSAAVSAGLLGWFYQLARQQTSDAYLALRQSLVDAEAAAARVVVLAEAVCEQERRAIQTRYEQQTQAAEAIYASKVEELHRHRDEVLTTAEAKYPVAITEMTVQRERELERHEADSENRLRELAAQYEHAIQELDLRESRETAAREGRYGGQWDAMSRRWLGGMARVRQAVEQIKAVETELFPDWDSPVWEDRRPPTEMLPAIPLGRLQLRLADLEGGLPGDERLRVEPVEFTLPALAPFPDRPILFRAAGEGRERAAEAIQTMMLRMLTALPPGKVRFTILDPVGLGKNFSAFMHLADFDEQLVASRIWTESAHIDRRLTDLTEHMENVIQVYLRNEFETIRQYNEQAGEMAEPYRVLVVANFPVNFSEDAARRLVSIVSSGARCGVHTLLSVDPSLKMPHDFRQADLESHSLVLRWKEGRFVWDDPELGGLPLDLASPPSPERFTELVRIVGKQVSEAGRVEVPFRSVTPAPAERWTGDASRGIDLPLGRAGAMKFQYLNLGRGTSQHVLLAGKTGSGKSNLLHAIITNTALWYGPDEVELYLVDFKKGVEFKDYAQYELPHARVIAIESEREFGLSVLERLDEELRRRGDLFRRLGVSDLPAMRTAHPETKLPRILLIIDEFQELFVEDDRVGQQAALLLDRLVRQGRAFGMHVLLGSQTLAGAYSLPRATMGQMAVRIALQCSEADAHLILSEENAAARLLTRPGEAIYNDANGLYEGNHPFQIVYLPETERDEVLGEIQQLARERGYRAAPPLVFEGNAAADPATNVPLRTLLDEETPPAAETQTPQAWLGAAVAIKEPTAVRFIRQGGNHLVLVGQRDEAALGVLANCLVSLAAQTPPSATGPTFYVFDGARPDAPEAGLWEQIAQAVPHSVKLVTPRTAPEAVAELAAELDRRRQGDSEAAGPVYAIVYNLARFRELRKEDDDFGFSRRDESKPASPGKQFAEILREGPTHGMHLLLWCDNFTNLARVVDRAGLRELGMRVVFQMNTADSSNLIDTADASRLGVHRALLYDEALGQAEKFRPYGPPATDWLAWVRQRLERRWAAESGKRKVESEKRKAESGT